MAESLLIADSGSTKTDWILLHPHSGILEMRSQGINPVRDSQDAIRCVLTAELLPQIPAEAQVAEVHFFGAGCIDPFRQSVTSELTSLFPHARIHVESDLLGAAIALCADQPGIACILGTGSNSCYYDGRSIVRNVSPMGFILGDEGSGAVLGRTLVGNLFKGDFPEAMRQEFLQEYQLTQADIIDRVYRKPQPNRFLASLVPFIARHRTDEHMHAMLVEAFSQFFLRNVRHYGMPDMPVHFVGGVACAFQTELSEAADKTGYKMGKILQRPAIEIANFYQNRCYTT